MRTVCDVVFPTLVRSVRRFYTLWWHNMVAELGKNERKSCDSWITNSLCMLDLHPSGVHGETSHVNCFGRVNASAAEKWPIWLFVMFTVSMLADCFVTENCWTFLYLQAPLFWVPNRHRLLCCFSFHCCRPMLQSFSDQVLYERLFLYWICLSHEFPTFCCCCCFRTLGEKFDSVN